MRRRLQTPEGLDLGVALDYARTVGQKSLGELTFHQRAVILKQLAQVLTERKDERYALSTRTGATKTDSWVDIDGGIGVLFTYSSKGRRELPNAKLFDGLTVKDLPRTSRELRERVKDRHVEDEEQLMRQADREAWLRLSVLLHEAGFRVVNAPGENLRFVRGEEALDLSETLRAFRGKDGSREAWVATWQALGLADRMLATVQVPV